MRASVWEHEIIALSQTLNIELDLKTLNIKLYIFMYKMGCLTHRNNIYIHNIFIICMQKNLN